MHRHNPLVSVLFFEPYATTDDEKVQVNFRSFYCIDTGLPGVLLLVP